MLQPNNIKAATGSRHRVKRIGRGNASGHGTSSTRGGKGQTARSGGSRGLILKGFKRILNSTPKLRGFKSLETKSFEVYLSDLEKNFESGATVDLNMLIEKKLISKNARTAKIVSTGEITKKITLVGIASTKGAAEKIKAVGGEIK